MLVPYSTDTALYHYPIATVVMIVINIGMYVQFCSKLGTDEDTITYFVDEKGNRFTPEELNDKIDQMEAKGATEEDIEKFENSLRLDEDSKSSWLMLEFGKGWRPWQWVTSMFMHFGIMHLVGNMIFLWSYGLVVEGKIGPYWFSGLYLLMGVTQAFIIQTMMFFSEGGALGASGAIFSLLALVLIFIPFNEFSVFLLFGRLFFFDITILNFALVHVLLNIVFYILNFGRMSSEALHLVGFFVGVPIGLLLVYKGIADCEGFDLISYFQGTMGKDSTVGKQEMESRERRREAAQAAKEPKVDPAQVRARMADQVGQAISNQQFDMAVMLQQRLSLNNPGITWTSANLLAVIRGYMKNQEFDKAEPLMEQHISLFQEHQHQIRMALLKIWLQRGEARRVVQYINGLNPSFQSAAENADYAKLLAHTKKLLGKS